MSYAGVLIGFVNLIIVQPEMLEVYEVGLIRMLTSTSIILGTLFPLGLNGTTIRFFPKFRDPASGNHGFINVVLLAGFLSYILFAIAVYLLRHQIFSGYNESPLFLEYFTYIFPMTFFAGMVSLSNGYAFALFKSTAPSFLDEIFNRVCQVVLICAYFVRIISFETFITLFMLITAVQLVILWSYLSRMDKLTLKIDWAFIKINEWGSIVKYTLLMALASVASRSLRQIDVVMVGSDLSNGFPLEEVAVYTIAVTIGSIIEVPANALSKIADPKIADALQRKDTVMIRNVYYKSTRFLMILGGLLFICVFASIHQLLGMIGGKYVFGEGVVIIIAASAFFNMSTGLNNSMIYYSEKIRTGTILLVLVLILSIVLNYFFIPLWGIKGAAFATAIAFMMFNLVKFLIILKVFKLQPFGRFVFVVLGLMGVCLGVNYFLPVLDQPVLDIIYRSVVLSLIYIAGIILSGVIPELSKVFRKEKSFLDLFQ
jgi:O-antigen/teichoic acid export membrane protein